MEQNFLFAQEKEVFDMWSEALLQMDENTLKYQVERMQAENEKLREQREADKAHRDIICPCKKNEPIFFKWIRSFMIL